MKRFWALILSAAIPVMIISGCGGGTSVLDELKVVPGLCFLHVHVSRDMDLTLIPEMVGRFAPMWLCDSLNSRGQFGVSLLGINLTDFSPQLLFLTRNSNVQEMLRLGTEGFMCGSNETPEGYDLIDERGSLIGSVAGRDGWTCLVTGSGADRSAIRWIELDEDQSLAADTDLVSVSGSDGDITLLVSRNSISFLSVIPTGMLTREEASMLFEARSRIQKIGLQALRVTVDVTDEEPSVLELELQLVREGGNIATITTCFSDTGFSPDSLISIVAEWTGLEETR